MKTKIFAYIWIATFATVLCLPAVDLFFTPNRDEFVNIEKREPYRLPDILSADNTKNIELAVQDALLFRHKSLRILSKFYYLFRTSLQLPKAIIGHGKWLFLGDAWDFGISKYRDVFGFNKVPLNNVENVQKIFNLAELKSSTKMIVIAPDKHTIYPEKLPSWITRGEHYNRLDLFEKVLLSPDPNLFRFLKLEDQLLAIKKEHQEDLYYLKDSHWNYVGGFEAYKKIIDSLNEPLAVVNRLKKLSEMSFSMSAREGDMAAFLQLSALDPDPIPIYTDKDGIRVKRDDAFVPLQSNEEPEAAHWVTHYKNENALNDRSILFLGDSFSKMILPYFLRTFSRVTCVHYQPVFVNKIATEELFSEGNFDNVVIVMVQRVI